MNSKYGDFWDRILAVINEASEECDKAVMEEKVDQFDRIWLARGGKIDRLNERDWFSAAKPRARVFGKQSIRDEVGKMVEYYRWAERVLRP